jgi:Zn-dependent protease
MSATVLPPEPAPPSVINSCPSCSHWLPDGTLACPDCQTLTYGQHLSMIAAEAQQLEQQQKWPEARDRWRSALQWLPEDTRQASSIQQHVAQIDARLQAESDQKARWTKRLGPFAPIALFLLKIKSYLFLAFKMKFLLSGLLYFGVYWAMFGWQFALGFTLSILIHEMGHYTAVKMRGLKADLPMFFPGMGAYVRWYGQGVSRDDLASIALAGPLFGLIAALGCYGFFRLTSHDHVIAHYAGQKLPLFLVLANLGAWINLLNLFPIRFMGIAFDGSQATYALSRIQRGLIAATCLLFFGLSAVGATSGDLVGPNTVWTFLIVGLGMAWRCFTPDTPEHAGTKSFVYFQTLVLTLGFLVLLTPLPAGQ